MHNNSRRGEFLCGLFVWKRFTILLYIPGGLWYNCVSDIFVFVRSIHSHV